MKRVRLTAKDNDIKVAIVELHAVEGDGSVIAAFN